MYFFHMNRPNASETESEQVTLARHSIMSLCTSYCGGREVIQVLPASAEPRCDSIELATQSGNQSIGRNSTKADVQPRNEFLQDKESEI